MYPMLKRCFSIVMLLATMTSIAPAQHDFQTVRAKLRQMLEGNEPDGTPRISKQLRRWEWFWESRVGTDGSFPTAKTYEDALQRARAKTPVDATLAAKVWKELGPTGPSALTLDDAFFGIGRVNCVAFNPADANVMLLGSAGGGLWKSTNGGNSWAEVKMPNFPMFGVSDVAYAPSNAQIIYVATGDANASFAGDVSGYPNFSVGIIKSTDGGATWAPTGLSYLIEQNYGTSRLWVAPDDPNVVLAATTTGIRRSTDGGATWKLVSSVANMRDMIQHPTVANILYATTFSAGGGAEFWRSTDAGQTWRSVQSVESGCRIRLAVTKAAPSVVWAVVSATYPYGLQGVYKSTDAGLTYNMIPNTKNLLGWSRSGTDWSRGGQGHYDLAMAVSPTDANRIMVGGINNWRSTNGGTSWELATEQRGDGAPWVHADQHFHAYHPTNNSRLYTCHDGGIARSTDNGLSWTDISVGLKIQQFYAMGATDMDPSLMIGGAQDNSTFIMDGLSFRHVIGGDGMECAIDPSNPNVMYGSVYYGTFYRSNNRGSNWTTISNAGARGENGAWVAPFTIYKKIPSTVFAGYRNVWKSTNNGTNWTRLSNFAVDQNATLRVVAVSPTDDRYVYAAFNQTMYFTTNGGQTWQTGSGLGGFISDIEVDPTDPKRIWITYGAYNGGVKVAEVNNGTATNATGVGLPNIPINSVLYVEGSPKRLFLGTDVGVYVTEIGSNVWQPYGSGMPTTVVSDLEYLPTSKKLRAATYGRGIWEVDATQCTAATPTIQALTPTTVCAGDSVVLQVQGSYSSVRWSNGDTARRVVLRTTQEAGDYTVSVEDGNGCRATSAKFTVTINRTPSRPTIQRRGDTLRSTTLGGVTSFQWIRNDTNIVGATQREYVPTVSGSYRVQVRTDQGCANISEPVEITVGPVSVAEEPALRDMIVSPNPTEGIVRLSFGSPLPSAMRIEIIDQAGRSLSTDMVEVSSVGHTLDLRGVAAGVYLVRCSVGNAVMTLPIVRQ